nr:hypothetical protein [Pandoravirus massiliensis]
MSATPPPLAWPDKIQIFLSFLVSLLCGIFGLSFFLCQCRFEHKRKMAHQRDGAKKPDVEKKAWSLAGVIVAAGDTGGLSDPVQKNVCEPIRGRSRNPWERAYAHCKKRQSPIFPARQNGDCLFFAVRIFSEPLSVMEKTDNEKQKWTTREREQRAAQKK